MAHHLIAVATCDYPNLGEHEARPQLAGVRDSVVQLFTGTLKSYRQELVTLATNPSAAMLRRQLNQWLAAPERDPEDWVVLYYTGHAEVVPPYATQASLYLLTSDFEPPHYAGTAFDLKQLADMLTAPLANNQSCRVRNFLLILDTCFSGQAVQEFASRLSAVFHESSGRSFYILGAALPREEAQAGALARALIESVEELAKRCVQQEFLFLEQIVPAINRKLKMQRAIWSVADSSFEEPRFFPNPSYVATGSADVFANEAQRAISDQEFREHWGPRARGVEFDNQPGAYFSGRTVVLDKLTEFIRSETDSRTRVVTGKPGSGKSAILSKIVNLSLANTNTVKVDLAIHAKGKTLPEMCQRFARVLGVDGRLGTILQSLRARSGSLRVLVDALDEAAEAADIATQLLRPLNELPSVKLLVGTRQELLPKLAGAETVDIDAPEHAQREDIAQYVKARLLRSAEPGEPTPYANLEVTAERVAEQVAAKAHPNFLVARLIVEDLLTRPRAANADSAEEMDFPTKVSGAFAAYLARFGAKEILVRDVLRPLAHAEGKGLPWDSVWAPLASQLAARAYADDDVRWVLEHAGSFILESRESGRAVYRLYHQALADMLRDSPRAGDADASFVTVLSDCAPRRFKDGSPDWWLASQYARLHLAAHAARAARLDGLVKDIEYLLWAEPHGLIRVLSTARSEPASLLATAYKMCAGRFINDRRANATLLQAAAFALGANELARLLDESGWLAWARLPLVTPHLLCTGHSEGVVAVAFGEVDGLPVIVSGSRDKTVRVWDARTGGSLRKPLAAHASVTAVALGNVDGTPVIIAGSDDCTLRVWDARTSALRGEPLAAHTRVRAVAFGNVDGTPMIFSGGEDRMVRRWDARSGMPCTPFAADSWVTALALGEIDDATVIISGNQDSTVRVLDARTGTPRGKVLATPGNCNSVSFGEVEGSPMIVAGSSDTARIWEALTCDPHANPLRGHSSEVLAVTLGQMGSAPVIVSGSADHTVRVWDARTGAPRGEPLAAHLDSVCAVALGEVDGFPVIVSGSEDRTVRVWDGRIDVPRGESQLAHSDWITSIALGEIDGLPVIVSGSKDRTVRVWDARTGTPLVEPLTEHLYRVYAVAFGKVDGSPVIFSASYDMVYVWDARTGAPWGEPLAGYKSTGYSPISALALGNLDGSPVIVAGRGDSIEVCVWDVRSSERLSTQCADVTTVRIGDWPMERALIVSRRRDKTARVWETRTGRPRGKLAVNWDWIDATALGEVDGSLMPPSIGGDDRFLGHDDVHDARTGEPLGEALAVPLSSLRGLALGELNGSSVIVSGSKDNSVRVWDARTRRSLMVPMPSAATALALDHNGFLFVGLQGGGLISMNLSAWMRD